MSRIWTGLTIPRLVAALATVAVLTVLVDRTTSFASRWTPNIATDAISLLITIAVVDRVVAQRERLRLKPRVDRAMSGVGTSFHMMVRVVAWDYKATHSETFRPIPANGIEVLAQWLQDVENEDSDRPVLAESELPMVITNALLQAESLQELRESEKDVLEPDVVAAIDEFQESARMAATIYFGMDGVNPRQRAVEAITEAVVGARDLGETLARHDRRWLEEGPVLFTRPGSWGTEPDPSNRPSRTAEVRARR